MFRMLGRFSSSHAPCVRLVERGMLGHTGMSRWFSSAPLNLSASLQTAACRRRACPCCTNGLPLRSQRSTSVQWRMFLNGTTINTIPHKYRSRIPREAAADSKPDSGTGSRLYEINIWMWRYGRTFPRAISVEQAVDLRKKRLQESRIRVLILFAACMMLPGRRGLQVLNECPDDLHAVPYIVPDIVSNITI
jgi:hypothetical protein